MSVTMKMLASNDPSADFPTRRRDEVGKLARVLNAMVGRLRDGARRLADAEHRATLGEVARQVNHDLRNGITPVRNVLRHLGETAEREPDRLVDVFIRRRGRPRFCCLFRLFHQRRRLFMSRTQQLLHRRFKPGVCRFGISGARNMRSCLKCA